MTNDLLFFTIALVDLAFVLMASRLGKTWLIVSIVLNLVMVSLFGAKLVTRFGLTSNAGNVFYACVFFGTQLLTEIYGKREAQKSILIGVLAIVFFMVISQLVVLTVGLPETRAVNSAIDTLFQAAPRVAAASLLAYLSSQFVSINLFSYLSERTKGKMLYLRVNLTNLLGQMVDSVLFFTVAFYGILPTPVFVQTLFAGYLIKVAVGVGSTAFFYLSGESVGGSTKSFRNE